MKKCVYTCAHTLKRGRDWMLIWALREQMLFWFNLEFVRLSSEWDILGASAGLWKVLPRSLSLCFICLTTHRPRFCLFRGQSLARTPNTSLLPWCDHFVIRSTTSLQVVAELLTPRLVWFLMTPLIAESKASPGSGMPTRLAVYSWNTDKQI